jgi:hypothetical protein
LFFNQLRRILFSKESSNVALSQAQAVAHKSTNTPEVVLYKNVFESFLGEYINYVQSLGISGIYVAPDADLEEIEVPSTPSSKPSNRTVRHNSKPLIEIDGEILSLPSTTVYFQKVMEGGVLFVELGLHGIYAYLNVYMSDSEVKRNNAEPADLKRSAFLHKTAIFKDSLHMNSFSYDFHIRNLHNYLTNPKAEYPTSIQLLSLIRDFCKFYDHVPIYARNVLHTKQVVLPNLTLIKKNQQVNAYQSLFDYICKNQDRYGTSASNNANGCLILQTYRSIPDEEMTEPYSYSVLASLSPLATENDLIFDIYIIYVNTRNPTPFHSNVEGDKNIIIMKPVLELEQRMTDVLLQILDQAQQDYKLDTLWDMAIEFKRNMITEHNFIELQMLWHRTSLIDLDPSLNECLSSAYVPWSDLISQLWTIYGSEYAGSVFKKDGSTQHFLIRCVQDENVLLHVEYKIMENCVNVYLCKKRLKRKRSASRSGLYSPASETVSTVESSFISKFVNHLCSLLWRFAISEIKGTAI